MPPARSMMYMITFNSTFEDTNSLLKLNFIKKIFIYKNYIILDLTIHKYITSIQKLLFECNIEVYNSNKLKLNLDKPIAIMEKEFIIKQPKQKENHIVMFANGRYLQREVIGFVLGRIFQSMKSHSKQRQHEFDPIKAKEKLLESFTKMDTNYQCGCNRKNCREIMQLYGENGISPDKENDNIGYCEESQKITLVIKSHNTPIKFDSNKRMAKSLGKWYDILATHMMERTKRHINRLIKKQQSESDKQQIKKYVNQEQSHEHMITMLKEKRIEQDDLCKKCKEEMYFGNEDDVSEWTNCGNKASPDRKDNENVFYDSENFDLVCCSCNFKENQGGRTFVEHKCINKPIPFTLELLKKCQAFIRITNFKRRKVVC